MTTENQDFAIRQGESKDLDVTVTDFEAGWDELTWSLATSNEAAGSLLEKTEGVGITVTSEGNGTLTIAIDSEDTENLAPGDYYHQLKIVDTLGNVSIVFCGTMTVIDAL